MIEPYLTGILLGMMLGAIITLLFVIIIKLALRGTTR